MSHFTVLVIGPAENLEAMLAPFQENNTGDCPRQYMQFYDKESEMLEEYNTEGVERVVMPDGSYKTPYDDEFRKPGEFGFGGGTHEVPAHLEKREVPYKELYSSFEEFAEDYHGYKGRDDETGRYGYWENPNRKWDWYQPGGRWTGFFKLKDGAEGEVGSRGLMTPAAKPGYVDSCRVGDIDIAGMRAEAEAEAASNYDEFHAIVAGRPLPVFEEIRAKHDGDYDKARAEYWADPVMQALSQSRKFSFDREEYLVERDAYLKRARDGALATFAVLKDGNWYEKGSMGWWGMVSDRKDEAEWNSQFAELFNSLPEDTEVTVVDCHI